MMIAAEMGIMPQLWDLFGKVVGYLASLTLIFHTFRPLAQMLVAEDMENKC